MPATAVIPQNHCLFLMDPACIAHVTCPIVQWRCFIECTRYLTRCQVQHEIEKLPIQPPLDVGLQCMPSSPWLGHQEQSRGMYTTLPPTIRGWTYLNEEAQSTSYRALGAELPFPGYSSGPFSLGMPSVVRPLNLLVGWL